MKTADFDYILPKNFIAQYPEKNRSGSRLLVYNREKKEIIHRVFTDLPEYLRKGDVLIINNSKVFPARLKGKKKTGGAVDILLVRRKDEKRWYSLARGLKKNISRTSVTIGDINATLMPDGRFWILEFDTPGDALSAIDSYGMMPLPHYVRRESSEEIDLERYQTVYAESTGSIAAPTAGFHFTEELLERIGAIGVTILKVTLHIGIGTFLLVKAEEVENHSMHGEYYNVTDEAVKTIREARREGRRVVACGTSVVRTLESFSSMNGETPRSGFTELFIYPGYSFKSVDALLTNFHLPRSTPLLLVSAFAGKEAILRCYREAIERGYRFYSYGDAMFIV